jgi:hypothetical protein
VTIVVVVVSVRCDVAGLVYAMTADGVDHVRHDHPHPRLPLARHHLAVR